MPYVPGNRGISASRLYAIRDIIRGGVDDLNTAFEAETLLAPMLIEPLVTTPVLEGHVKVGMPVREVWNPRDSDTAKAGPLRIYVLASDNHRGLDFDAQLVYIPDTTDGPGFQLNWHTSIMVYVHSGMFRQDGDADLQSEREELAMATLSDWLRNLMNAKDNLSFTLTSQEYHETDGDIFDQMKRAYIKTGFMGRFGVAFGGGVELVGLHFLHGAEIA